MPQIIGSFNNSKAKVEQSTGQKVVEQKSSLIIHFEDEQRRWEKQLANNEVIQDMRPWLKHLSDLIAKKDLESIKVLFIQWAHSNGFTSEGFAQALEDKIFKDANYITFCKVVYNKYLSLFDDCNKKMRGSKMKKTKYSFEKEQSKKDLENKEYIEAVIENFISRQSMLKGFEV